MGVGKREKRGCLFPALSLAELQFGNDASPLPMAARSQDPLPELWLVLASVTDAPSSSPSAYPW